MNCHICGGNYERKSADLPFRLDYHSIVIIKALPILECDNCREYTIEDQVMKKVEEILDSVDNSVELEIVDFEKSREPKPAIT